MVKHLKEGWFMLCRTNNYGFEKLLKGIAGELKYKAGLNIKFKCVCITMCSLVMNP